MSYIYDEDDEKEILQMPESKTLKLECEDEELEKNKNTKPIEIQSQFKDEPVTFNITSTKNPIEISLPLYFTDRQMLEVEIIECIASVSTISPCNYEFYEDEDDEDSGDENKENINPEKSLKKLDFHRLKLSETIQANAFDLIFINTDAKTSRKQLTTDINPEYSQLGVMVPIFSSESKICCPEGEFINHKIVYKLNKNLNSEMIFLDSSDKDKCILKFYIEYYNKNLVEFIKAYNFKCIIR